MLRFGERHVDLRPQDVSAIGELAGSHAAEEVEVLVGRSCPVGTVRSGLW